MVAGVFPSNMSPKFLLLAHSENLVALLKQQCSVTVIFHSRDLSSYRANRLRGI